LTGRGSSHAGRDPTLRSGAPSHAVGRRAAAALWILLACLVPLPAVGQATGAPDGGGQTRVLLLYTESRLLPSILTIDQALRDTLQSRSPRPVYFYTEYLDTSLFDGDLPQRELHELLRRKYAGRGLDLVVATGSRALRVAVRNRTELFGGAPVVFVGVDRNAARDIDLPPDVTGVWARFDWVGTLEVALRLQPATERAVVVTGSSPVDRVWLAAAREQLAAYPGRLEIRYLTDFRLEDLLQEVAALPARTVVLMGTVLRDASGRDFVARDVVARAAQASRVPVYSLSDTVIGTGVVGGHVVSFEAQGVAAAEQARQVLGGQRPVPTDAGTHAYLFDWRELQRWGLDERRLPAGSRVLFRAPSAWARYRWWILGGATALLLQSGLIAGLLLHRAQRRRAQHALTARLRFERLMSELSATFLTVSSADMDREIVRALRLVVEELEGDRGTLVEQSDDLKRAHVTHTWTRPGVDPLPADLERGGLPWMFSHLERGRVVPIGRVDDLPASASIDRQTLGRLGTRSLIAIPLQVGGALLGVMAIAALEHQRAWPDDLIRRLRLLGEIVASALARRKAERAADESERRFQRLADSAPVMVWMSGSDGRCTYVNERWLAFTGRQLEDELGDGWAESVHPADRDECQRLYREAMRERREFTREYRLRRRDSMYRWVLDHGAPRLAEDGVFAGHVGSCIDVTELKTAQRALAETHALRSAIFGSLYGEVAALDRHGVVVAANEAWTSGASPGMAVGANFLESCRQAAAAGDPTAQASRDAIVSVLEGARTQARFEYADTPSAEERWVEVTVERVRAPAGGVVISRIDITRRRQAEEAAQRQREELAHVLRVTTLGELAASLAHELNQPLAAILSNAQASRRLLDAGHADTADVREALADIGVDAKRASEIIRRLRALFRKEPIEHRALDVNQLIRDVASLLRADLLRNRIVLVQSFGVDVPRVLGDAIQLQQVMLNLLVNARDAIVAGVDGPREIRVETSRRDPARVAIAIRDTGVGVKEADLERMFEHFVSTKPGGLGMGLAISRSIVQAHSGRIWASPGEERGLTVVVELPAAPEAALT
jgi:PAS domain S-box-containing protein